MLLGQCQVSMYSMPNTVCPNDDDDEVFPVFECAPEWEEGILLSFERIAVESSVFSGPPKQTLVRTAGT